MSTTSWRDSVFWQLMVWKQTRQCLRTPTASEGSGGSCTTLPETRRYQRSPSICNKEFSSRAAAAPSPPQAPCPFPVLLWCLETQLYLVQTLQHSQCCELGSTGCTCCLVLILPVLEASEPQHVPPAASVLKPIMDFLLLLLNSANFVVV